MTIDEPQASSNLTRRMLLRNGLMVGLGTAVVAAGSSSFPARAQAGALAPASSANPSTPAPEQIDWGWCNQCQGMFYTANSNWGYCPGTGNIGPHASVSNYKSYDYGFYYDAVTNSDWQGGWWWCKNCQGLFNNEYGNGACPFGTYYNGTNVIINPHNPAGSFPYVIYHGSPVLYRQPNWYYCANCHGLYYTGSSTDKDGGVCPLSCGHNPPFLHVVNVSFNYAPSWLLPEIDLGPASMP